MKYTEYTFEHFDSASGAHKVSKWVDGPSVDFLDYTVNKNKKYHLSYYDTKSLVFNFIRNKDQEEQKRIIDILNNASGLNAVDFWDSLLDYNINSNHKDLILELAKFLLDKEHYPSLKQTISLISLNSEEVNNLLKDSKRNFNFSELNFDDYFRLLNVLTKGQLEFLEELGFKRNQEWDITMKTLKEQTSLNYRKPRLLGSLPLFDNFCDDSFFRQRYNPLSLL